MTVLVTGGAGYIGSHTCMELIDAGYDVVVIDNLSNSSVEPLKRIENFTGKQILFYHGDIRCRDDIEIIFRENKIDAVIHFAAVKSISESVAKPLKYYENNILGTINLLHSMENAGCRTLVFSSSASVYGIPAVNPIREEFPIGECTNAYARTKVMAEQILKDFSEAQDSWNIIVFRYFNPIGAHPSGVIGEEVRGVPSNLIPYITQVASGNLKELRVFGDDYPTPDGTGVRDYIHVADLARAHVECLKCLEGESGYHVYNLGTGQGSSVLQMLRLFEKVTGKEIPYRIEGRRSGDVAECYCDASKAREQLGWEVRYSLEDMCRHAWMWQKKMNECSRTATNLCDDSCGDYKRQPDMEAINCK